MDGMFAFTIWDYARQELIIARDKSGKKPFVFHRNKWAIYFCIRIKSNS